MIFLDIECTISNKGNAYDQTNHLVCVGVRRNGVNQIEYAPFSSSYINDLQILVNKEILVGFNIKFDLHWLSNIGINVDYATVWDCSIAEFLLSSQQGRYPSLNDALTKYGFPLKLDVVEKEYWTKGINTDKIPRHILSQYLEGDLEKTEQVYKEQWKQFSSDRKSLFALFKLQCADLITLLDMERNGVYFNTEKALEHADGLQKHQNTIQEFIRTTIGDIPVSLTADRDISTILYGGVILQECRIPIGVYMSGDKRGQTRYRVSFKTYECPRLVDPLPNTQVKEKIAKSELDLVEKGILKEPRKQYKVNEETLKMLKAKGTGKKLIDAFLEFNKLEKLRSTYLVGWSELIKTMNWKENMLHSNFNQVTTVTGRLSSTKPNQQNPDKATKTFCESRYD